MAKKSVSGRNAAVHYSNATKFIFLLASFIILVFLILIVKTTSFKSEPKASYRNPQEIGCTSYTKKSYCLKSPTCSWINKKCIAKVTSRSHSDEAYCSWYNGKENKKKCEQSVNSSGSKKCWYIAKTNTCVTR